MKVELILLYDSIITTLSSLLWDTGEAIRRLITKDGGFARRSRGTDRGPLMWTSPDSGGTSTHRYTYFQVTSEFRATTGHSNNLPPTISVNTGRERRTVSVNCRLDTSSGRTYLSGDVLQFLDPIDSFGLDCYLRLIAWGV